MGPDQNVHFPFFHFLEGLARFFRRPETGDDADRHRKAAHPLRKGVEMLHGEDRRRNQDRHLLASVGHRFERRPHRHFGLPVAHVAANKPVHRLRRDHILFQCLDRENLVFRFDIGKFAFESRHQIAVGRIEESSLDHPFGIELQKVVRIADDLRGCAVAGLLPPLPPELA